MRKQSVQAIPPIQMNCCSRQTKIIVGLNIKTHRISERCILNYFHLKQKHNAAYCDEAEHKDAGKHGLVYD